MNEYVICSCCDLGERTASPLVDEAMRAAQRVAKDRLSGKGGSRVSVTISIFNIQKNQIVSKRLKLLFG